MRTCQRKKHKTLIHKGSNTIYIAIRLYQTMDCLRGIQSNQEASRWRAQPCYFRVHEYLSCPYQCLVGRPPETAVCTFAWFFVPKRQSNLYKKRNRYSPILHFFTSTILLSLIYLFFKENFDIKYFCIYLFFCLGYKNEYTNLNILKQTFIMLKTICNVKIEFLATCV